MSLFMSYNILVTILNCNNIISFGIAFVIYMDHVFHIVIVFLPIHKVIFYHLQVLCFSSQMAHQPHVSSHLSFYINHIALISL